jgi:hypothetical protein
MYCSVDASMCLCLYSMLNFFLYYYYYSFRDPKHFGCDIKSRSIWSLNKSNIDIFSLHCVVVGVLIEDQGN